MTSKSAASYTYSALPVSSASSPRRSHRSAASFRADGSYVQAFSLANEEDESHPASKERDAYLNHVVYVWLQTHRVRIINVLKRLVMYMMLLIFLFTLHRYSRAQKKSFTLFDRHINQTISQSAHSQLVSNVVWPILPISHRAVKMSNPFAYDDFDVDQSTLPLLSREVLMLDPRSIDGRESSFTNSRLIIMSVAPSRCLIQPRINTRGRSRYVLPHLNITSAPFERDCRGSRLCLGTLVNVTAQHSETFMLNSLVDFGHHSDSSVFLRSILQFYYGLPPFVAFISHRVADRNEAVTRLAHFLSNNAFHTGETRSKKPKQPAFFNLLPGEYECHEVHFNSSSVSKHDHVEVQQNGKAREHNFKTMFLNESYVLSDSVTASSDTNKTSDSSDEDDEPSPDKPVNENVNIDAIMLAARFLNTSIPARICSDRSDAFVVSRSALLAFPPSFYQQLMKSCEVSDPALRSVTRSVTCMVDLLWPHIFTVMNDANSSPSRSEPSFSLATSTFSFYHNPLLGTPANCAAYERKNLLHHVQRTKLLNLTDHDIESWPTNPRMVRCPS